MKRKSITLLVALFFLCPLYANASTLKWDTLINFLETRFPPTFKKISQIKEKYKDRVVFRFKGQPPKRGTEYLVLSNEPNVPLYLQRPAGVIRVESIFGEEALAQVMAVLGQKIAVGDNIVIPSSPVIYLYTNIKDKDVFEPYQTLRDSLLKKNYEVVEIKGNKVIPATDRYGIVIRLEGGKNYLVCKVQSLYSKDTLFAQTIKYSQAIATEAPVGQNIILAARQPVVVAQPPMTPTGVTPPVTTTSQAGTFHRAQVPSATVSDFRKAMASVEHNFYRVREDYKRFVICEVDGDRNPDFVFLNDRGIFRYTLHDGQLEYIDKYTFNNNDIVALHLHAMDLDGDGKDELLVTLAEKLIVLDKKDSRLVSMILTHEGTAYSPLATQLPYYLRVIQDRSGKKVLLAQRKGKYDPYDGDIYQLEWDSGAGSITAPVIYEPARDIYSIYQFNLVPDNPQHVIILEPNHYINGYFTPEERVDATSDIDFGPFREIPYPIKLEKDEYRGGFDKKTFHYVFAPRRFELHLEYDGQSFLINKEREPQTIVGKIKTVIKQGNGKDSIAAVKWIGNQIPTTWESKRISKDLLDFSFVHQGNKDMLFVLVRDQKGYAVETIQ